MTTIIKGEYFYVSIHEEYILYTQGSINDDMDTSIKWWQFYVFIHEEYTHNTHGSIMRTFILLL